MKNRRIRKHFLGVVHVLILAMPLVILLVQSIVYVFNGNTAIFDNGVASQSLNYDQQTEYSAVFTNFMTNYADTFTLINADYLDLFGITSTNSYMLFANWYLNYMLNMSLVLFLPEVLLWFIEFARNMLYRVSERSDII